ncbi:MAG: Verru_Chthon cassette protein B [Verrucomicrobiota bacterium]
MNSNPEIQRGIRFRPPARGFTLAEVILSMGIIASVSIPMVALLALGLENMRESKGDFMKARIEKHLSSMVTQANWGETNLLKDFDSMEWEYDGQGTPIEDRGDVDPIYVARVGIDAPAPGAPPEGLLMPGSTTPSREMKRVTITISDRPGLENPFSASGGLTEFSFIATRNDRR